MICLKNSRHAAIDNLSSHCRAEISGKSRLTPISKSPRAGLFNQIELAYGWSIWKIGVAIVLVALHLGFTT